MSFISKKMQEYEDGTFRLVRENEDGSGLFIYKGETIILKRCKRGYWKDPATGECVPKEQLQGTEQPKAVEPKAEVPKQETPKEKPKKTELPTKAEVVSILNDKIPEKYHKYIPKIEETSRGIDITFGRDSHGKNARRETYAQLKEAITSLFQEQGYTVDDTNWGSIFVNTEDGRKKYDAEREKAQADSKAEYEARRQKHKDEFEEIESKKTEEDKEMDRWGVNSFIDSLDNSDMMNPIKLDKPLKISAVRYVKEMWDEDEYNDLRSEEDKIPPAPHTKYFDRSRKESKYGYTVDSAQIPKGAYVVYDEDRDELFFYDRKKKAWGMVSDASDYINVD